MCFAMGKKDHKISKTVRLFAVHVLGMNRIENLGVKSVEVATINWIHPIVSKYRPQESNEKSGGGDHRAPQEPIN